jgi:hypothetical protein
LRDRGQVNRETGKTIEIQTETVDHFCSEHGVSRIDILKVDAEGAEARMFRGAEEMCSRGAVRSVFVEVYFDSVYEGMPFDGRQLEVPVNDKQNSRCNDN